MKKRSKQNLVLEIYGRRVLWMRLGRSHYNFCKVASSHAGQDNLLIDLKTHRLHKLKKFKDMRRANKFYYYDWGEIDRLIYKYFIEKKKYYEEAGMIVEAVELPDEILQIRNQIIEMLFNLVNTIIYTHSFHQQIDDSDLFQDSIEKLILLLDKDKHNPIRGTSFTFFTIALKNMIFTQLKKQKRYVLNYDEMFPGGGDNKHHNKFDDGNTVDYDMGSEKDLVDALGDF